MKHGTHVDSGQMYLVYLNQAAASYLSLYYTPVYEVYRVYIVFVFSVNIFVCVFVNFFFGKFFVTLFSGTIRPSKLKLGIHVDNLFPFPIFKH